MHITFRAIGAPGGGSASSPWPAPAGQTPVVHVDARLVVIDVVVTGKQGRLVTGLKKEDFAAKENGKDQAIKAFEAHMPLAHQQAGPKFNLPPYTYTNVPMQPLEISVNIELFDLMNTPLTDQPYARAQMVQFLKTLPVGQRVALFVLGSGLRMISGFTQIPISWWHPQKRRCRTPPNC